MDSRRPVPWRTIWAAIGSVVLVLALYQVVTEITRIIAWVVIAGFFTLCLNPAVDFFERRAKLRRGVAVALVVVITVAAVGGMLYSFIRPLVDQGQKFADDLPHLVEDAKNGRGTIGHLVDRYNVEQWVQDHQQDIQNFAGNLRTPALGVLKSIFSGIAAFLTIFVLTVLMLLQGPKLTTAMMALVPTRLEDRVRAVANDCAKAVSGYIGGNLVISVVAGIATWVMLSIVGVPYAAVLGLFVAFCDLIPLVGATLGAIPTIGLSFLHSVPAGVTAAIFYVVYQQFENHILGVAVMSKTVRINPLGVFLSVLVSVELFGFLGALLAVPAAGMIQVIARDIYDVNKGRIKEAITVGTDSIQVREDEDHLDEEDKAVTPAASIESKPD